MLQILRSFLEIALLMRPPQDLPASRILMYLTIVVYALVNMLQAWPQFGALVALLLVIADIMVISLFIQIILFLKKHPGRFVQALTAIMGAGTVINILMLPLVFGIYSAGGVQEVSPMVMLAIYILVAWLVTVNAYIFRFTFDLPNLFIGVVYAIGLLLIYQVIVAVLFGELIAS